MAKNLRSIYSLGGLLVKKKTLKIIKAINILRIISGLRFFKVNYYPYDYNNFVKFYNKVVIASNRRKAILCLKSINVFLLDLLNRNLFLRKKFGSEIRFLINIYKKRISKLLKKDILLRYLIKIHHKFKFKKLKKVYYLAKFRKGLNKRKKPKRKLLLEDKQMQFFSKLVKNKKSLRILYHYIHSRFKKPIKKKFRYLGKQKTNTQNHLRYKLSDDIVYRKVRARKKTKVLYKTLRIPFKGKNFREKEESADNFVKLLFRDKSKKKIKWLLKKRKKKYLRKLFLIKKYKRLIFRRKKRTGILHFRDFYSNYYITLTDLSHNVIFSCSAGSVSDTNNKKTKMSNVVSMPIFYRILFFLRAFKIKNLKFVFRNKIDKIVLNAINFFGKGGYKIKSYSFIKKLPHHLGQRKQKPRRI